MTYETIEVTVSERGIATVMLNRPERSNALNPRMLEELAQAARALDADEAVRIVVLRGAGRHFCAGADVGAPSARPAATGPEPVSLLDMVLDFDQLAKPVIAVVQGACLGGGLGITVCCDVVLAEEGAFFSIPEARLGFAPSGLMALFIRAMGDRNFRRYGLSGERISAAEALRIGLASEVLPMAHLDEALAGLCDALLQSAPRSIAAFKAIAARFTPLPLPVDELKALEEPFRAALNLPDAIEGIASFKEKRKPNWYRPG